MRASFVRSAVAALGILVLAAVVPGHGEDYLVIKKKGGPTQRIPLNFSPENIESFQVESGPSTGDPPAKREQGPEAEEPAPAQTTRPQPPGPPPQAEPKPLPIRPAVPSILREPQESGGRREAAPSAPPERLQRREGPVAPTRRPPSGPVAAEVPRGIGSFYVNVYKLPAQVKTLPDYSAFRPQQTINTDRINLEPSRGDLDPPGLAETDGLGLRCVGMFMVSGEGIFNWRVYAKDGVRLSIDDKTVIENDGIHEASSKTGYMHLSEGAHSIVLDSFNGTGPPVLRLLVTPPVGQEQIFSIKSGLAGWKEPAKPYDVLWGQVYFVPKGAYPEGPDFSKLSPIGRLIAPELNIVGGDTLPGLPGRKDMVGVRYEGFFNVEGAGIFAFRLLADHFAKLAIGDKVIADVSGATKTGPEGKIGWAFLQKGSYPIAVDYFHPSGPSKLELFVTQPEKQEELFTPAHTLHGFSAEEGKLPMLPVFVYFLKPGTKKMPSFNKLTPAGMFFTGSINYPIDRGSVEFPGVPKRDEWLGLRFYVKFALSEQEAGEYKFRIVCRDAARLIIGKKLIINAEGTGKVQDKTGSTTMEAGSHEMFLDYIHSTGPNGVQLYITPPGGEEKIFAFQ